MPNVRVHTFSISADGYGAGPDQSLDNPLGVGGEGLHSWFRETRTFHETTGSGGGETGPDDEIAAQGFENVGAWILGRNMFGPIRGPWPADSWKGWWGDDPPYHTPVFVLTHHPRDPLPMHGGTTFHFVTDGIHAALDRAREAAGGQNVRVGGGVSVVRQYLVAGLVDEVHLAISPVILGRGEHLLHDIDLLALGCYATSHITTPQALHITLARQ